MINNQVWIKNNIDSDILDYDYDIVKKDEIIELKYSNSSDWSEEVMGKICATLKDDGNGIKLNIGDKKIKFTYNELRELKCLLMMENDEHIEIRETKTIKMLK
jgi:hypothetical protein